MIRTIPVAVSDSENYIERIGTTVNSEEITTGGKLFLAEKLEENKYYIIGFSDESAKEITDLREIKSKFALKYLEASEELREYRKEHSKGNRGNWGTGGLHRNVHYFELLAEQCYYLIKNEYANSLVFWREKAGRLGFAKNDFLGKGRDYTEYLPIQHVDVDGVDIVFDPNDVLEKAKECGVVYSTVDEMLAFANAGDLAYGGATHE